MSWNDALIQKDIEKLEINISKNKFQKFPINLIKFLTNFKLQNFVKLKFDILR